MKLRWGREEESGLGNPFHKTGAPPDRFREWDMSTFLWLWLKYVSRVISEQY